MKITYGIAHTHPMGESTKIHNMKRRLTTIHHRLSFRIHSQPVLILPMTEACV